MWQTDFTYFKIYGWGWYYLSTILDDYSRYIVTWKLCSSMKAEDVKATLDEALLASNLKNSNPPRLLSDNGSCYISGELAEYIEAKQMTHVRGRPLHPQTQGKIERYHRSMKNVVKLDNYFSPGQLENKLRDFVHYYNHERYHESIENLTPAEVYFGQAERKLKRREKIKIRTLNERKKQHRNFSLN
jgi:putative transposase